MPMSRAVSVMDFVLNLYDLGNVCNIAPSRNEMARFCVGCPKRPQLSDEKRVVIVGAGLSHHMRP